MEALNYQLQATMDSFDLFVPDLDTHLLPNFGGGSYASETTVAMFKSDDGLNWTATYQPIGYSTGFAWSDTESEGYMTALDSSTVNGDDNVYFARSNSFNAFIDDEGLQAVVDVPDTNGSDTGLGFELRSNYATLTEVDAGGPLATASLSNGNLTSNSKTNSLYAIGSLGVTSGKWYWEATFDGTTDSSMVIGVTTEESGTSYPPQFMGITQNNGDWVSNIPNSTLGASTDINPSNGDVLQFFLDMDAGKLWIAKNNTVTDGGNPISGTSPHVTFTPQEGLAYMPIVRAGNGVTPSQITLNFGQMDYIYSAPTGYKTISTYNLPSSVVTPSHVGMEVVTYTGNGGTQSIDGMSFSPDLVIIKNINSGGTSALWQDTIRGTTKYLRSASSTGETTTSFNVDSFDPDGFTVTGNIDMTNQNGEDYVAWCWNAGNGSSTPNTAGTIQSTVKANPITGFSIVSYTGNGKTTASFGHGLGVEPKLIVVKARTDNSEWPLWHADFDQYEFMKLNKTLASQNNAGMFKSVNSSIVTIGQAVSINTSNVKYIAYCWSEVEGYSKIGSYTGTGIADDGPFIYTGFRPRWIMVRKKDGDGGDWYVWDSERDGANLASKRLAMNLTDAETVRNDWFEISENGFRVVSTGSPGSESNNGTSEENIYIAYADHGIQYGPQ